MTTNSGVMPTMTRFMAATAATNFMAAPGATISSAVITTTNFTAVMIAMTISLVKTATTNFMAAAAAMFSMAVTATTFLNGGQGADRFVFQDTQGPEADIIEDFETGVDRIDFTQAVDFRNFNDLTNGGSRYMEQVGRRHGDPLLRPHDHA